MATPTGSGPKGVKLVYDGIRIHTLADLRDAAAAGDLRTLRGFGTKVERKTLAAVVRPTIVIARSASGITEVAAETGKTSDEDPIPSGEPHCRIG